jgi:signal transduction histidine kinase
MTLFKPFIAAVLALSFVGGATAQERGTKAEAKAMADAAFEHIKKVGADKAYKDFTTDRASWNKKDLYVMVYDGKGIALANGANEKLVGKDLSSVKDGNGVPIITGMVAVAAKGGGWFDYDWPDPLTKKMTAKSTFARKQPSGDGFIGVGVYR